MSHSLTTRLGGAVAAAALLTATLAACGSGGTESGVSGDQSGDAADGGSIVLLVSTLNNPFFVDLRDGAQEEAAAQGLDLRVSDAQNDSATQANQAQDAQAQGAAVVLINPVDSDAAAAAVEPLLGASIPVVSVDRAVEGVAVTSHVASDNVAGGTQAADAVAEALGGEGTVLVLEGVPGTSAARDRGQGFTDGLAQHTGLMIAATQTANFDRAEGLDVATNLLQAHPDVTAIFAQNDEMALGAIQALGSRAGSDVLVFGFDGTDDGLAAIEAGTMLGSIAQQPRELGKIAVQTAAAILRGETPEAEVSVPVQTVTSDNVSDFTG